MRIGQIVVVVGYSDNQSDREIVFERGDLAAITDVRSTGDMTCHRISFNGRISPQSDLMWPEEVIPVNNAPLVVPTIWEGR